MERHDRRENRGFESKELRARGIRVDTELFPTCPMGQGSDGTVSMKVNSDIVHKRRRILTIAMGKDGEQRKKGREMHMLHGESIPTRSECLTPAPRGEGSAKAPGSSAHM